MATYEIEKKISSGNFGTVYSSKKIDEDKQVAVKILRENMNEYSLEREVIYLFISLSFKYYYL